MNNKNKVLSVIFIIINAIYNYALASGTYIDRMPPNLSSNAMKDFRQMFLGKANQTLYTALFTILIFVIINKLIIKEKIKGKTYIFLFAIIFIINIIMHRIGIKIVY